MNEIELDLDLNNELEFKISVEGTKPAAASCRLVFENNNYNISFPGQIHGGTRATVNVPPLEHILEEGQKKATLEMIVDDRIFKPLTLSVNFKKSVKVFAEAVVKDKSKVLTPSASASLVINEQAKPELSTSEKALSEDTDVDLKPDWPVTKNKSHKSQNNVSNKVSNLTEEDLRDKIRTLLINKRR